MSALEQANAAAATGCQIELPRYQSHKVVHALKIKELQIVSDKDTPPDRPAAIIGAVITPEEERYAPFHVDAAYVEKHNPQVGGYYVQYKDGYKSFSPAEAFEDGYTLIS